MFINIHSFIFCCLKICRVLFKRIKVKATFVENGVIELHVHIQLFYPV